MSRRLPFPAGIFCLFPQQPPLSRNCSLKFYHDKITEMAVIPCKGREIIVDEFDLVWLSRYRWHFIKGYPKTAVKWKEGIQRQKNIYLHHFLLPPKKGSCVDHINQNPLDNRRENLRYATYAQNRFNSNKTKGISFEAGNGKYKRTKPWRAHIYPNNKHISLGMYKTKEEALEARRLALKNYI